MQSKPSEPSVSVEHCDLALARRLERAEGRSNAEFVEARTKAFPEIGGECIEVAGAYAMYDGVGSPCTQTFGLGLFDSVTDADIARLEQFFERRGSDVFHEVSPLAEASLLGLLNERGYHPIELSSVLFRSIQPGLPLSLACDEPIQVRQIESQEHDLWARIAASGWADASPGLEEYLLGLGKVNPHRPSTTNFLGRNPGRSDCGRRNLPVRRRGTPRGSRYGTEVAQPRSPVGTARTATAVRCRMRVRTRHDRCRAGQCFAAQRRAAGLSRRLHSDQMAARARLQYIIEWSGPAATDLPDHPDSPSYRKQKMSNEWSNAEHALDYLRRLEDIPHRKEGEATLIAETPKHARRILDLGCGDGHLLALLLAHCDRAAGVGLDFSPTMLQEAERRFVAEPRVRLVMHNLDSPLPDLGTFDVIASSFAIHHCVDERKRAIYQEVCHALEPGGVFCNLEHVASPNEHVHQRFLEAMNAGSEEEDPSNKLLDVETQLQWLREIGYEDVDCYWKWRELALLVGRKPQ